MSDYLVIAGLSVVMALTLFLPFSVRKVEEELELFLLCMGSAACTISSSWSGHLALEALREPVKITLAVLVTGLLFRTLRPRLKWLLKLMTARLGITATVFVFTAGLGLASSFITAIIAALVLAEAVTMLKLRRDFEVKAVVYACFAIGLGAVLTPLGEPLSTIAVAKLKGEPHNAGFFYLFFKLWAWIIPGVLVCSALAARGAAEACTGEQGLSEDAPEDLRGIFFRAFKVYVFVAALVLLGAGLSPVAERFVTRLPAEVLYWLNSISAVLDNATLVAAELTPAMTERQITFILMGLLVSGGMLIPGNIPNIISASKLGIRSREWAAAAVPPGLALMAAYFVLLLIFVK